MLTDERIIELIEAYGTDPRTWPESERAAGRAALSAPSEAVETMLATFAPLDALLANLEPVDAPDRLMASILDGAPSRDVSSPAKVSWLEALLGPKWAMQVSAAAASLVVGLGVGLGTASAGTQTYTDDSAIYAAFGVSSLSDILDETNE
ncbi:MAG: hypothetical protein AAF216_12470 [Pseudomonadota bacterium]